jgi:hypothetical protein
MREGLKAHQRIHIMGCVHMVTGENLNLPKVATTARMGAR